MRRRAVDVKVGFLHVFAVVSLWSGQAEEALFQDRVAPIPQRDGEAETTLAVADAEEPVLTPAIRPAAGLVVREVVPDVAVRRVVLAHGAPLPLGEIGTP